MPPERGRQKGIVAESDRYAADGVGCRVTAGQGQQFPLVVGALRLGPVAGRGVLLARKFCCDGLTPARSASFAYYSGVSCLRHEVGCIAYGRGCQSVPPARGRHVNDEEQSVSPERGRQKGIVAESDRYASDGAIRQPAVERAGGTPLCDNPLRGACGA